jgi:eukaryotic-like serine/threonine-protein kinase
MPSTVAESPTQPRTRRAATPPPRPRAGPHDLARLLPAKGDPDYLWVLCEMVRADLELTWSEGRPRRLGDYRTDFPELFQDIPVLRAIASEEYQIREAHGDRPDPGEYAREYGVTLFARERCTPRLSDTIAGPVRVIRTLPETPSSADYVLPADASAAVALTAPPPGFPAVGETFLGFRLTEELGRGAFARVYLARQLALADRAVALKVTTRPTQEPERLAKLQHTNIVPIFSVHTAGSLQAVCMPFLGRATLADTLAALRKHGHCPQSGSELFSTV